MPDDNINILPVPVPAPSPDPTNIPPAGGETPEPIPPRHVPVGELAEERQKRHTVEAELAALRKEIEDAQKTAEQRIADDLRAAQALAQENAAKALRYEIAVEADLPLALAPRLTGATREEMLADAVALKSLIPAGAMPPRTPAPDPGQGPRPGDVPSDDAVFEQFAAALKLPSPRK